MHHREVELKLALAPEDVDRLRRQAAWRRWRQGRAATRRQVTVYFDTADPALAAHGIALRIRHIGPRRIQGIKAGSAAGALMDRPEREDEIMGDSPRLDLLGDGPWAEVMARPGLAERLRPVFRTEVTRTVQRLGEGDAWAVEAALDQGAVVAGERRQELSELELELISGPPGRLFDLARALHATVPLRVLVASKSDRGYALAAGQAPRPRKAGPLRLEPGGTAAQAFQVIGRHCLGHLLANEAPLAEGRQPEAVHQLRVALRRFRSALKVLAPLVDTPGAAAVLVELRWLLGHLGPARDLDVFIAEMLDPVVAAFPDEPGLPALRAEFEARRDAAYDQAVAAVASPRWCGAVLTLAGWLETGDWLEDPARAEARDRPVEAVAQDFLSTTERKMRKAGRKLAALSPEDRHRVRIRGKRLRYGAEFFASLYDDKAARRWLDALAEVQERLGHLNDSAVATGLVAEATRGDRTDLARAGGLVIGWHGAHLPALLIAAQEAWKDWREHKPFW